MHRQTRHFFWAMPGTDLQSWRYWKDGKYSHVSEICGRGDGRPVLAQELSDDAKALNAPLGFSSESMGSLDESVDAEVLSRTTTIRKAKARRKKA